MIPMSDSPQIVGMMPQTSIPSIAPDSSLDPEKAWQQLLARDPQARFFYGVETTGVFCRPGCASRRPRRENVRFFQTVAAAAAAGFRPCQRCRPAMAQVHTLDEIRGYIEKNFDRSIRLEELGELVGMSSFAVRRLFKRAMGASPLEYQRALRAGALRASLKQGNSVTEAIYSAGFGAPSRAYAASPLGMTPSRFAQGGKGERIGWCSATSPFGWMIVGATARGLCWLALAATKAEAESSLRAEFPAAELRRDPSLKGMVDAALAVVCRPTDSSKKLAEPQVLDLRGTAFQLRVWQALRRIPRGETRSYSQLACALGSPNAARAVARACATNRVAILVPCHRVIGADGSLAGYRWGIERKRRLLAAERNA